MTIPLLRVDTVPIDSLTDFPGNARRHDTEALDESVTEHGQYRAIVTRELPDGTLQILAGHGTRDALARAGHETVQVEVRSVPDDALARRIVLMDNAANDRAAYDQAALLDLLDLAADDGGLLGTGFDTDSVNDLRKLIAAPSLDDLAAEVGDPESNDHHVIIRLEVDPEDKDVFDRLMDHTKGHTDAERFSVVVSWAAKTAASEGFDVQP